MTSRVIVPPKLVTELRTDQIDFTPVLLATQEITAVAAFSSVYSGTDPNASSLITALGVDPPLANITYGPGVVGVIYAIRLEATTSFLGDPVTITYFLAVIPEMP